MGRALLFRPGPFWDLTSRQQISCWAAIAVFNLFIWSGRLGREIFPVIRVKRIRDAIGGLCAVLLVLWWMVFFRLILPRCDFTVGQFAVVFLWGFIPPAGAFTGLIWGIETAARRQTATFDS
jgi:hypothetical protein